MQLLNALGAESMEEAISLAEAAGIKPQDVPSLLMSEGQRPMALPLEPEEEVKLTRRQ
jgi:3-hydroxyisobutyrate dehydrogenase-like beta-hydroxyacid dehydrogenase